MKDPFGHGSNGRGAFKAPTHQSRIVALVSAFAKSTSGEGKVPKVLHDFDIREKGPSELASVAHHAISSVAEGRVDLHALVHFAHFLGFLGAIAVIDLLALGMGLK